MNKKVKEEGENNATHHTKKCMQTQNWHNWQTQNDNKTRRRQCAKHTLIINFSISKRKNIIVHSKKKKKKKQKKKKKKWNQKFKQPMNKRFFDEIFNYWKICQTSVLPERDRQETVIFWNQPVVRKKPEGMLVVENWLRAAAIGRRKQHRISEKENPVSHIIKLQTTTPTQYHFPIDIRRILIQNIRNFKKSRRQSIIIVYQK